jgi:glycerophosphoryl diester phosphodiesterase
MTAPQTQIAAHRGGADLWPENSEAAFRGAIALGVEQIEFDVQLSADGVPVIFHDATLERMTDGSGPLAERTLAELRALTLTGGGAILTLDEGLDLLEPSSIVARCEIKPGLAMRPYPGLVGITLAAFEARGMLARAVISSFHLDILRDVAHASAPLRDRLWLVADQIAGLMGAGDIAALARRVDARHIASNQRMLRMGDRLALLRETGLTVSAFAVHEDDAIGWALSEGLPVFTTDRPDTALRLRGQMFAGAVQPFDP